MSDFTVEIEREDDGRWIGEVTDLPGALAYGSSRDEAVAKAVALAFRVLADRWSMARTFPRFTASSPFRNELVLNSGQQGPRRSASKAVIPDMERAGEGLSSAEITRRARAWIFWDWFQMAATVAVFFALLKAATTPIGSRASVPEPA